MGKLILMIVLTALGIGGCLAISPFCGVAIYYLFAVLRPHFLWIHSLPEGVAWSFYVAVAAIVSMLIWRIGVALAPNRHRDIRLPAWNVGHLSALFFAFWIFVTYQMAYSKEAGAVFFEEYVKIFIMFFVAAAVITNMRQLVGALSDRHLRALLHREGDRNEIYFFQGGYMFVYRRGYAGLDNNGAALMLAMGVPMALFAWDGIQHRVRWLFLACIPLLVHAVLTSYSRGAMLSLIISLPIYMIRARHKKQLGLILLGIGLMIPFLAGKEIQERFFSIKTPNATTAPKPADDVGDRLEDGPGAADIRVWGAEFEPVHARLRG